MTNVFLFMTLMAAVLMVMAARKGKHREGVITAKNMFLQVLPILICAFVIVGYIEILLPKESLQHWLGPSSGWKGLFAAAAIGALIQGGPYALFPMYNAVFREYISTGAAVAMITAWGTINVGHLPYEFAFLGRRFVMVKYGCYLLLPLAAGFLAQWLFG